MNFVLERAPFKQNLFRVRLQRVGIVPVILSHAYAVCIDISTVIREKHARLYGFQITQELHTVLISNTLCVEFGMKRI